MRRDAICRLGKARRPTRRVPVFRDAVGDKPRQTASLCAIPPRKHKLGQAVPQVCENVLRQDPLKGVNLRKRSEGLADRALCSCMAICLLLKSDYVAQNTLLAEVGVD